MHASPDTCGGGGKSNQCGAPDAGSCVPQTCKQERIGCGTAGVGCGNLIQGCTFTLPVTCGGCGTPCQCGILDGGTCVALTCAEQNINCGPAGDGCGNLLMCGTCSGTQTCGGGGTPWGECGGGVCSRGREALTRRRRGHRRVIETEAEAETA